MSPIRCTGKLIFFYEGGGVLDCEVFLFVGLLGPNGPCVFEAFVKADSVFVGFFWGRVETHIALVEFGWFSPWEPMIPWFLGLFGLCMCLFSVIFCF